MQDHLTLSNKVNKYYNDFKAQGSIEEQKSYLYDLINYKIDVVNNKSVRAKNLHYFLRISILVLAGLVTAILGWKGNNEQHVILQTNTALVLSAIVSFISGLAAFWDIDNYRFRIKVMANNLKVIRYELTLKAIGENPLEVKDLESILDDIVSSLKDGYWEEKTK